MNKRIILAIAAVAGLSSAKALAQDPDTAPATDPEMAPATDPGTAPAPDQGMAPAPYQGMAATPDQGMTTVHQRAAGPMWNASLVPMGLGMQLGGGVTGFSTNRATDVLDVGGFWDVRAIVGTRSFIGAELAYVGSARSVNAVGLSSSSALLGTGVEADVRGNLPMEFAALGMTPYVFVGAGWTNYHIVNKDGPNISDVKNNANEFVLPFGAGASFMYRHLLADARFTYRGVWGDDLMRTGPNPNLQNWAVGATLGYEF